MKKLLVISFASLLSLGVVRCTRTDAGIVGGGIVGGVVGNAVTGRAVGTAVGAVGGAVIGANVARHY